jgi:hypothetical protein
VEAPSDAIENTANCQALEEKKDSESSMLPLLCRTNSQLGDQSNVKTPSDAIENTANCQAFEEKCQTFLHDNPPDIVIKSFMKGTKKLLEDETQRTAAQKALEYLSTRKDNIRLLDIYVAQDIVNGGIIVLRRTSDTAVFFIPTRSE